LIQVGREQEREWRGSSALATACVLNLANVALRMMAFGMGPVRARGIPSVAAFNVLTILDGEGGPLLPSTIAERMILTRGTVTGILDTLERRNLVRRARHDLDGRMRLVTITSSGSAAVAAILPQLHEAERTWMDSLTRSEQRRLLGMLAVIQAHAPD
jgi:DNA-binding MarR family transcriptional regulator